MSTLAYLSPSLDDLQPPFTEAIPQYSEAAQNYEDPAQYADASLISIEHSPRRMQTTIAIAGEAPHRFKIRPLKEVGSSPPPFPPPSPKAGSAIQDEARFRSFRLPASRRRSSTADPVSMIRQADKEVSILRARAPTVGKTRPDLDSTLVDTPEASVLGRHAQSRSKTATSNTLATENRSTKTLPPSKHASTLSSARRARSSTVSEFAHALAGRRTTSGAAHTGPGLAGAHVTPTRRHAIYGNYSHDFRSSPVPPPALLPLSNSWGSLGDINKLYGNPSGTRDSAVKPGEPLAVQRKRTSDFKTGSKPLLAHRRPVLLDLDPNTLPVRRLRTPTATGLLVRQPSTPLRVRRRRESSVRDSIEVVVEAGLSAAARSAHREIAKRINAGIVEELGMMVDAELQSWRDV